MSCSRPRPDLQPRRFVGGWWLALLASVSLPTLAQGDLQHPLELRALVAPEEVLQQLPAAIEQAVRDGQPREVARLRLAEANACRVIADWNCQRNAGMRARIAAGQAKDTQLLVRGLIQESRGLLALQDHVAAERLLTDARERLAAQPSPELEADIELGLSSLAMQLGNMERAVSYAERGLAVLGAEGSPPMRARLHRNLSRALTQQGDLAAAQRQLDLALQAVATVDDPKLRAELHLSGASLAARQGDLDQQRVHIAATLALTEGLSNTQLHGLGHEALARLYRDQGDIGKYEASLTEAIHAYENLSLLRDAQRVDQTLLQSLLRRRAPLDQLAPAVERFLERQSAANEQARSEAAGNFEARLEYAEQQVEERSRLQNEAHLAEQRARALAEQQKLGRIAFGLGLLAMLALASFYLAQRRANRRLLELVGQLNESEARSRDLLQLSRGAVFLHDLEGRLLQLNPAAAELLGLQAGSASDLPLADLLDAQQAARWREYLLALAREGEAEIQMQLGADDGPVRTLRLGGRVSRSAGARPYAVTHAVDITEDVEQAEQLREQAQRDPLTGCFNRRYLHLFADSARADARWAAINIDLDQFKAINDREGHERGDQVLREVADFLHSRLRDTDALLRVGGDEFLILIAHADEARVASLVGRLEADRSRSPCRYSLGHAIRQGSESLESTLARADAQMYERRRDERSRAGS